MKASRIQGSNYGVHVCDCHYEDDGCIQEENRHNTCNCDANLPEQFIDTGTITNTSALPVARLFFGGLSYEMQEGAFKLGRLKCYGEKSQLPKLRQRRKYTNTFRIPSHNNNSRNNNRVNRRHN